MGLGSGALIFNQIILAVMNPNNIKPDPSTHLFPPEVANNLPLTWRVLAGVYLLLGLIGTAMMIPKKPEANNYQELNSLITETAVLPT
jgi:hypothetical protein